MRKTVLSIVSNIAEGKERKTSAELIRFLFIAKGSAGELRAQLIIAKDIGYIDDDNFQDMINRITKIAKMIHFLIKYVSQKK